VNFLLQVEHDPVALYLSAFMARDATTYEETNGAFALDMSRPLLYNWQSLAMATRTVG
jgi:hypothetical protein